MHLVAIEEVQMTHVGELHLHGGRDAKKSQGRTPAASSLDAASSRLTSLSIRGSYYRYMQKYFNRKERRQGRVDLSMGREPYPWQPRGRVKWEVW